MFHEFQVGVQHHQRQQAGQTAAQLQTQPPVSVPQQQQAGGLTSGVLDWLRQVAGVDKATTAEPAPTASPAPPTPPSSPPDACTCHPAAGWRHTLAALAATSGISTIALENDAIAKLVAAGMDLAKFMEPRHGPYMNPPIDGCPFCALVAALAGVAGK